MDLIRREAVLEILENGKVTIDEDILDCQNAPEVLVYLLEKIEGYLGDAVGNIPSVEDVPVVHGWIPCSERLPENETEVEISCIRSYIGAGDEKKVSHFTTRAFYTDGTMTTEDSNFLWKVGDNWEYDEEKDAYIIPECWWVYVAFSEDFGVVDDKVIAWMPLPEPYKGE